MVGRAELDREVPIIDSFLRTAAPAEGTIVELSIAGFERFRENWKPPWPKHEPQMPSRIPRVCARTLGQARSSSSCWSRVRATG